MAIQVEIEKKRRIKKTIKANKAFSKELATKKKDERANEAKVPSTQNKTLSTTHLNISKNIYTLKLLLGRRQQQSVLLHDFKANESVLKQENQVKYNSRCATPAIGVFFSQKSSYFVCKFKRVIYNQSTIRTNRTGVPRQK